MYNIQERDNQLQTRYLFPRAKDHAVASDMFS